MATIGKRYNLDCEVKIHRTEQTTTGAICVIGTPYDDTLRAEAELDEVLVFDLDLTHPTVDKSLDISDVSAKLVTISSCDINGNPDPVLVKFNTGDTGVNVTSLVMEGEPAEILLSTIDKNLRVQVWVGGKD